MRLLITGSHGQVARAFIDVAPAAPDIEACAIGRPGLDICNSPTIERALSDIKPDVVINTAAYTAVDDAEGEAERAMALNRDGAAMLAAAAAKRGTPIIHLSTDYVFDGAKPAPYVEDDATAPTSVYGLTKLAGEHAVAAANPKHIILRTAWVYSPFGKNFVRTMLRLAETRDELAVVSDQWGNPTSAHDIADAILRVAAVVATPDGADGNFGVYHLAGTGATNWAGFARRIFEVGAGQGGRAARVRDIPTSGYPTRAARPMNSRLNCEKFAHTFGWRAPAWEDSVETVVRRLVGQTS